eukprot:COSAG04_NODE_507_length_13313_cov_2.729302_10_plen_58_part_00
MTTVRRPFLTVLARSLRLLGSTVPPEWSASRCSESLPAPSTTIAYGRSLSTTISLPS